MTRLIWMWWKWNVTGPSGPVTEFGRVYYVTDDFGGVAMVDRSRLAHSLGGGHD